MSSNYCIKPYTPEYQTVWNNFLSTTSNGLFIHNRLYMEYHANRFQDASLIIYKNNDIVALFPATLYNNEIVSHAGLTYGGLLVQPCKGLLIRDIIEIITDYYHKNIIWKCVPALFHVCPSDAEEYWLSKAGYKLVDEKVSLYIPNIQRSDSLPLFIHPNKVRDLKVANRYPLTYVVGGLEQFKEFWRILEWTLGEHHNTKPTHTLDEIRLLHSLFPKTILLRLAVFENEVIAGAVVYKYGQVSHTQYLATTNKGRELMALNWLIMKYYTLEKPSILNFGHSHEPDGSLNMGLYNWKSKFGCSDIVLRTYKKEGSYVKI